MILADKIVKLRKQLAWSQEELAMKMEVSRQSVSKWESGNSIPDLKKIITLAEIFEVSTDFLLKDDCETLQAKVHIGESIFAQISLEQALSYVDAKLAASQLITKGVLLCVCSAVPLFFLFAMAQTNHLGISEDLATGLGILSILISVSLATSFFIKTNKYQASISKIEKQKFELAYGVHSVFQDKREKLRPSYNFKLSISIFLFIISSFPLIFIGLLLNDSGATMMMLVVMFILIATGLYILLPVATKFEAISNILKDRSDSDESQRNERAKKLAGFYWPLLIAIFLGWSLWTMDWGTTWIIWPVGAVLFAALVGLMELFEKES
jgi:transcriptional regulator with XRE-family HTH domain